jgi:hypothetical protein
MLKVLFIIGVFGIVVGTIYFVFSSLKLGKTLDRTIEVIAMYGSVVLLAIIVLVLCGDGVIGHREIVGALQRFLDWLHN